MRYRRPFNAKGGRWFAEIQLASLNLPRLDVAVDGTEVIVAASYGNGNSDPVWIVDVNLSGTILGPLVGRAYWWIRERSGR